MYYILELAELSKLNKQQGGDTYKKENKATLELANAVGRKLKGAEGDSKALNKGCQIRLQQLADKGYLAVKRSKQDLHQLRPARYPGWEGRPRYGPTISFPLPPPPAAKATPAPHKPKSVKPSPAESKRTPPAAAAPTASPILQTSQDLQSKLASAVLKQTQPTAAGPLPPSSQTPTPTPQTAPSSAATVASVLALSPPFPLQQATATAKIQLPEPSSGHTQQQPLLSGTTAVLVAAVGPLFESFVAQTAAVATDPSVSLETLTGSITQQLAAAIANAAVQVVAQRQQQLTPTTGPSSAHVPLSQAASLTAPTNALVPAEGSEPAVVGSSPMVRVCGSSSKNVSVDTSKEAKSVATGDSKEGQTHCDDEAHRTDKANIHNDGSSKVAFTGSDGGHRKHVAASSDVGIIGITTEVDQNKKRVSSNGKDQHSGGDKRQKTGAQPLKGGMTSQGHVVQSKHASRSDTSTSDRAQRSSVGRQAKGQKGSGRGSPGSRGSRGSGRSSPKEMGPIDAASRSHNQKPASPQPVGRNNLGPAFQHAYGAGPALLPSRLSGHYAGSPMTSIPLSFVPNAPGDLDFRPSNAFTDVMLSPQAGLANGFMPLMPTSPGNWHMQQPALNNFPMAAHFLPGVDEAPDFSPVN